MLLSGKTVLLGITGGIAAYKGCELARLLLKAGADVHVIMTKSAAEFVTPLTFRSLTQNPVTVDMFAEPEAWDVRHVSLAKRADAVVVAPATANFIAKAAHGICDDMLTSTFLACRAPKILAPAMNTAMFENPITRSNCEVLRESGAQVLQTGTGLLACGDVGEGKMLEPSEIMEFTIRGIFSKGSPMNSMVFMVTAGPTREGIDPVRFISNRSSGKMGYSIAREAWYRGAAVELITGPVGLEAPVGVRVTSVTTAEEMLIACRKSYPNSDVAVFTAAVGDYRPERYTPHKVRKAEGFNPVIRLIENPDIAGSCGEMKRRNQINVGFAAETEDLESRARQKMALKNLDMVVANDVSNPETGFDSDFNEVTIITPEERIRVERARKELVASAILDELSKLLKI